LNEYGEAASDAEAKSLMLSEYYRVVSEQYGCDFMNAGDFIVSSDIDGIHFEADQHKKLGEAVVLRVKEILG
jgi:hypothetical protein